MILRLGLVVDSLSVRAWTAHLAERLSALDGIEIAVLIDSGGSAPAQTGILDSYLAFERRFLHNVPDLSHLLDLHTTLPNIPIISADEIQKIQLQKLDILISFQDAPQHLPFTARFGTWMWNDISHAAGFREVLERIPLTICALSARLPNGESRILRRAVFSTDWFSAARNRNRVYIKAGAILVWALKKLMLQGNENFASQVEGESKTRSPQKINIWEIAALAWKQAGRALEKKFRPRETWLVFAEKSAEGLIPDSTARASLIAPPDIYWADPIAVERDGRVFLFVEEYIRKTRRGRIACLTLDDQACVISHNVALERPYHLSYPFIFEHQGETYMIPETASQRAIELYHCIKFPNQWEFFETIMKDVYAVDTTLLKHGGRWWLFTNLMTEKGASSWDELHLFFADDPLSSNWTPHPLNPILSDARVARPAGPFFTHNGILYRPSQDSSQRYGYALNLNRVDILTEGDYAEICVEQILPQRGLLATHTYSRASGWIFTDGVTRNIKEVK